MDLIKEDALHKPLGSVTSIRVLLLQPSADESAGIRCSLVETSLEDCERSIRSQYTALSYVWGDIISLVRIDVNDSPFHVTHNLFHALRDLRDATSVIRLWVDAICIDQSNILERNQQVGIMGSIYTAAQQTVIYLGEATTDSEELFGAFKDSSWVNSQDSIATFIQGVLRYPWFDRAWVFQELVLSRDPWVQIGRLQVRWAGFCQKCLQSLSSLDSIDSELSKVGHTQLSLDLLNVPSINPFERLKEMHDARRRYHAATFLDDISQRVDLGEILCKRRGCGVTDPRDIVFAHQGFVDPQTTIPIDYNKSLSWVLIVATRKIMEVTASNDILHEVTSSEASRRPKDLPSWVPNFTSSKLTDSLCSWYRAKMGSPSAEIFLKDSMHKAHPTFSVSIAQGLESLLVIDGKELDVIEHVSPVVIRGEHDNFSPERPAFSFWSTEKVSQPDWETYIQMYEAQRAKSGFEFLKPLSGKLKWPRYHGKPKLYYPLYGSQILFTSQPTRTFLVEPPPELSGYRVAQFKSQGLGIVPATAEVGDILCNLHETSWLLRRYTSTNEDQERTLRNAIVPIFRSYQGSLKRAEPTSYSSSSSSNSRAHVLSTRHVELVGACLVDDFLLEWKDQDSGTGSDGWDPHYRMALGGDKKLFVIH